MANMFYSLEEAAKKLGKSVDAVRQMADAGQIQQFRDRDKLMFKREQIDSLAGPGLGNDDSFGDLDDLPGLSDDALSGSSFGSIPLSDETNSGIDLSADTQVTAFDSQVGGKGLGGSQMGDPSEATGVSVFDVDEVGDVDSMAQTQITSPVIHDDEELSLESVGSGSGLLDLTRESDDTSLGAELLDEIYPGGDGSDAKFESAIGSSGVFDDAAGVTGSALGDSGITGSFAGGEGSLLSGATATAADLSFDDGPTRTSFAGDSGAAAAVDAAALAGPGAAIPSGRVFYADDAYDPAGSGFGGGVLIGTFAALVLGMLIISAAVRGVRSPLVDQILSMDHGPLIWAGGLFAVSVVLGVIGLLIGRRLARRAV